VATYSKAPVYLLGWPVDRATDGHLPAGLQLALVSGVCRLTPGWLGPLPTGIKRSEVTINQLLVYFKWDFGIPRVFRKKDPNFADIKTRTVDGQVLSSPNVHIVLWLCGDF